MANLTISSLKPLFVGLFLSIFIIACNQESDSEKVEKTETKEIPQLNDSNIHAFSASLSKEYFNTVNKLITAFDSHKKAGKHFEFTQFRNNIWTPAYMEEKDFYQSVYKKNKAYINSSNTKPLFLAYENLIYTGIYLKRSLLNEDVGLEKEARTSLEQDKAAIKAVLKLQNNSN